MNPEMEIQLLEGLLDEILAGIQELLSSGERLSDELQGLIADEIEATLYRIDQLRSEVSTNIDSPPSLNNTQYPSSNINALKYNPDNKQLFVKFNGKDVKDAGPIYSYQGVEPNIFEIIYRGGVAPLTTGKNKYHAWFKGITPSHGASVNALLVKGNYPYTRLS